MANQTCATLLKNEFHYVLRHLFHSYQTNRLLVKPLLYLDHYLVFGVNVLAMPYKLLLIFQFAIELLIKKLKIDIKRMMRRVQHEIGEKNRKTIQNRGNYCTQNSAHAERFYNLFIHKRHVLTRLKRHTPL